MIKLIISIFLCLGGINCFSQTPDKPFIHLVQPSRETNLVTGSTNFIIGSTCKTCMITVNGSSVKVYPTGAFAVELNLHPGDTSINLAAVMNGKINTKKITYSYTLPKPAEPVKELGIESIQTYPEGNLIL
ncbi:MAG: hypothetical protein ABIU77_04755, partial [Ferruginibacter sp.]